jgi:hypothetical protein
MLTVRGFLFWLKSLTCSDQGMLQYAVLTDVNVGALSVRVESLNLLN